MRSICYFHAAMIGSNWIPGGNGLYPTSTGSTPDVYTARPSRGYTPGWSSYTHL